MNNSLHSHNAAINTCIAIGLRLPMHSNSTHRFRTRPHFGLVHYHHSGSYWHFDTNTSLLFSTVEQTRKQPLLFCRTVHLCWSQTIIFQVGLYNAQKNVQLNTSTTNQTPQWTGKEIHYRSNRTVATESIEILIQDFHLHSALQLACHQSMVIRIIRPKDMNQIFQSDSQHQI